MATTGINEAGIQTAMDLYTTWKSKVQSAVQNESIKQLSSAIAGSSTAATATQLVNSVQEKINEMFQTMTKDFDNALPNVLTSYKNNDASNTAFSDATKIIKS